MTCPVGMLGRLALPEGKQRRSRLGGQGRLGREEGEKAVVRM